MRVEDGAALVTGANRGLGRALAAELLARGAKVYAGARKPESVDLPGAVPLRLDITEPESLAAAAAAAPDVTVLVNNAGIITWADLLTGSLDDVRAEFETHYVGTLLATRAFVPVIEANGGGTIMNVLSVLSWQHSPRFGGYPPAKAAQWALTNSLRVTLAPRGIRVAALHVGFIDTDMIAGIDAPKNDPARVAAMAVDGIAADAYEVLADDMAHDVRAKLSGPLTTLYPALDAAG